ncbi:hypothetical protein KCM76_10600 [Zooshikella marina]|uniref:hypothetical protein n=1 Tax=Zooshikella ganghwensis TaxID=202772 RepID=UPI001BAF4AE9|nr:hypothetical protein [Zooshikella ganghwensis]MBU2706439.1 hypothetical protein [Zooshikella ganghwensis]
MTIVYSYHSKTGEYLTQVIARSDPLEGKPLVAAYATLEQPPMVKENEVAVFKNNHWIVLPDYRGIEYWLPDGTKHQIKDIGVLEPTEAMHTPPQVALKKIKQQISKQLKSISNVAREKVSSYSGKYALMGWNDKIQRGQRVLEDSATDLEIAILQMECEARGNNETPKMLASKHIEYYKTLAKNLAIIDGAEFKVLTEVKTKRSEKVLSNLVQVFQEKVNQIVEDCERLVI